MTVLNQHIGAHCDAWFGQADHGSIVANSNERGLPLTKSPGDLSDQDMLAHVANTGGSRHF